MQTALGPGRFRVVVGDAPASDRPCPVTLQFSSVDDALAFGRRREASGSVLAKPAKDHGTAPSDPGQQATPQPAASARSNPSTVTKGRRSIKQQPLHPALAALAEFVREVIEETARPPESEWVDQHESPLGKRRHLDLVRSGALPGSKRGRRVYARRSDIEAYIASGRVAPPAAKSKANDVDDELRAIGFEVPR